MQSRDLRRPRGLALIIVLSLISLLTLLATAVLALTHSHARLAARSAEVASAEVTADSAIRLALLQASAPAGDSARQVSQGAGELQLFGQKIGMRIELEERRVDLNVAAADLISAILARQFAADAAALTSRILDWRDADDVARPGGAEAADYLAAGLQYAPRNGAFETLGEVRQVLGLAQLAPATLDAFTIYTQSPIPLAGGVGTAPGTPELLGQLIRIHACANSNGIQICRAAIVLLTGNLQRPFEVFAWFTEPL